MIQIIIIFFGSNYEPSDTRVRPHKRGGHYSGTAEFGEYVVLVLSVTRRVFARNILPAQSTPNRVPGAVEIVYDLWLNPVCHSYLQWGLLKLAVYRLRLDTYNTVS